MATPPIMNGMNFFNLNSANTPSALFGAATSNTPSTVTSSTFKESCKYVNANEDDEMDNENDEEQRIMGGASNQIKMNSNSNNYNRNDNERTSHVTGEENTN